MFFGKINRFLRDLNASILPIFALMAVPMILVAGMATDLARHHNTNEHVQMALDSAGLAAARHARINLATPSDTLNAEIKEIAQNYFDAALQSRDELSMQELTVTRKGPKLLLSAKGELPTSFMRMTGKTTLEVDTKSEIVIGEPTSVEIALVLDMSFSMIGTRLAALQTGASGLVDTLVDPTSDKVKVSIVPFGQYVNVGKKNRNKSWIDVPANERIVNQHCRIDPAYLDRICTWKWVKCVKDGLNRRCRQRTDCDESRMANAPKICRDTVTQWKWFGCVRSRKIPWDVRDLKYGTHPVEGFLSVSDKACASPITPLTNNVTELKSQISKLSPRGHTQITQGLYWGYRTLSSQSPFSEGKSQTELDSEGGYKALILMSDGANTLYNNDDPDNSERHGIHEKIPELTKDAAGYVKFREKADKRTMRACEKIDKESVEVYTIAFDVNDTATEDLLKECATSASHFFKAENAAQLKKAFEDIAASVHRDIAVSA